MLTQIGIARPTCCTLPAEHAGRRPRSARPGEPVVAPKQHGWPANCGSRGRPKWPNGARAIASGICRGWTVRGRTPIRAGISAGGPGAPISAGSWLSAGVRRLPVLPHRVGRLTRPREGSGTARWSRRGRFYARCGPNIPDSLGHTVSGHRQESQRSGRPAGTALRSATCRGGCACNVERHGGLLLDWLLKRQPGIACPFSHLVGCRLAVAVINMSCRRFVVAHL